VDGSLCNLAAASGITQGVSLAQDASQPLAERLGALRIAVDRIGADGVAAILAAVRGRYRKAWLWVVGGLLDLYEA
jgi:hypothetical protein